MDLLETQASDLRFLTQISPPAAANPPTLSSPADNDNSPQSLVFSPSAAVSTGTRGRNKRKATTTSGSGGGGGADDDDADSLLLGSNRPPRSKRNRYISIACNECKRRKIKCNGGNPCGRCGNLNLRCLYAANCCSNFKESDEFRNMTDQVNRLQEQVESLFHQMTALHQDTLHQAPTNPDGRGAPPQLPSTATVSPSPSASIPLVYAGANSSSNNPNASASASARHSLPTFRPASSSFRGPPAPPSPSTWPRIRCTTWDTAT